MTTLRRSIFVSLVTNEFLVMSIIALNALVFIFLDIDPSLPDRMGSWILWIDYCCVVFFTIELIVKAHVMGLKSFFIDNWNKLDSVIVLASMPILLEPFVSINVEDSWIPLLRLTRLIRLSRFLRLTRLIRYLQRSDSLTSLLLPCYFLILLVGTNVFLKISEWDLDWLNIYYFYYPSLLLLIVTWVGSRLYSIIHEIAVVPALRKDKLGVSEAMETIISSIAQISLWALGIGFALEQAGYNSSTVLAGLGIGGMAVAFAAQDLVSNVIGGLMLYAQRPFEVGDQIHLGDQKGTVRKLGLRSVTLSSLDGELTSVPNKMLMASPLTNISTSEYAADKIVLKLDLLLSADKLGEAASEVALVARSNQFVNEDFVIKYAQMEDYSHTLVFNYQLNKTRLHDSDPSEQLIELIAREHTSLYVKIISTFQKIGVEFHKPSYR